MIVVFIFHGGKVQSKCVLCPTPVDLEGSYDFIRCKPSPADQHQNRQVVGSQIFSVCNLEGESPYMVLIPV